jgi:epoxide hydrolase-like predicted phosphatase
MTTTVTNRLEWTVMAIKAVVFDLGGVLEHVEDDAWPEVWIGRWERRVHLPLGHVVATLAEHEPTDDMVTGKMSEAQMRERYARMLGLDNDLAQQMMAEMWDAYCGELDRQMWDFAASLRPAFATAILSNSADGARREEQRRFGFAELVDVIVYSHEVGLAKPDPAIFKLTEERLRVEPHEIVFLDDHYGHVEAARACGWHAVWHRDTTRSIQEISEIIRGV